MAPIRVCQLITELRPAGAERCVYELARRLHGGRFHVRVAALRGGAVADALRSAGIETAVLNVRGKWDVTGLPRLARLLRRWRIELLHTHLFHADLAGRLAAAMAGVPHVVHTVHVAERRFRPWQFAWARVAAGRCDRIVAVSRDVAAHHAALSGLPAHRYQVIPNGIDVAAYARDEAARKRLRAQWGVSEGRVVVVAVGRLDRQKGLDVFLRAAGRLCPKDPDLRVVIAGEGPQRKELESLVAQWRLGACVRLLGFVQDVRALLSAADVFAMPSRWEGFGLAAVEAMAAGLPVVASRAEGLREVVEEGRTGLLVDAGDAEGLARCIDMCARDPAGRAEMGRRGAARAAEFFDICRCVASHERLYLEVCGGGKAEFLKNSGQASDHNR
jgi:glycosyltransferase involved in cell wall biosynthesis